MVKPLSLVAVSYLWNSRTVEQRSAVRQQPLGTSDAYKLTVETSIGTFKDLEITAQSDGGSLSFAGGTSHEITLNIGDKELGISSVTVSGWVPVIQNDDLNLVE